MRLDYWKECILTAAEECRLDLTDTQLRHLAAAVENGHANYGMAFGHDCIPDPTETESKRELHKLKAEKERREQWENITKPCKFCVTTGQVKDCWGRAVTCSSCNGAGRI